jgi:hypothetical protein
MERRRKNAAPEDLWSAEMSPSSDHAFRFGVAGLLT